MGLFDGTPLERPVVCETCGKPVAECVCPTPAEEQVRTPVQQQTARLAIEKRKKGKVVTIVRGLADEGDHLSEVLSALKSQCGAGGSVQDGELEIQGRQIDRVKAALESLGYQVRGG
jgi:translation initiation factor 1